MNTITPINFKANYQPMKKISKVVKQEVLPAKQDNIKKSTTKSVFQKLLAVVGLGTLSSSLKEMQELNKYLGDTTGINKMAVKRATEIFKEDPEYAYKLKGEAQDIEYVVYRDKIEQFPDNDIKELVYQRVFSSTYSIDKTKSMAFIIDCINEFPELKENKLLLESFAFTVSEKIPLEYDSNYKYEYYTPGRIKNRNLYEDNKLYSVRLDWCKVFLKQAIENLDSINEMMTNDKHLRPLYDYVTICDEYKQNKDSLKIANEKYTRCYEPVFQKLIMKAINKGHLPYLPELNKNCGGLQPPFFPEEKIYFTDRLAEEVDNLPAKKNI